MTKLFKWEYFHYNLLFLFYYFGLIQFNSGIKYPFCHIGLLRFNQVFGIV